MPSLPPTSDPLHCLLKKSQAAPAAELHQRAHLHPAAARANRHFCGCFSPPCDSLPAPPDPRMGRWGITTFCAASGLCGKVNDDDDIRLRWLRLREMLRTTSRTHSKKSLGQDQGDCWVIHVPCEKGNKIDTQPEEDNHARGSGNRNERCTENTTYRCTAFKFRTVCC